MKSEFRSDELPIMQTISDIVDQIQKMPEVSIYNTDGKRIFSGSPQQLSIAWKNNELGSALGIGSISTAEGKSLLRFGAIDGGGFINRSRMTDVFDMLAGATHTKPAVTALNFDKVRAALAHDDENRALLLQDIKTAHNNAYKAIRFGYSENLFMCSLGIKPDGARYKLVDETIGKYFEAHGIAKTEQLKHLIYLLENGIDRDRPFYTAPFAIPAEDAAGAGASLGTSSGTAYKDGIAVLVGGYKQSITDGGIKHVFINDWVGEMVEPLRRAFPKYKFHLLSEQKAVLEGEAALSAK